jgi:peroxiredoxin
MFRPDHARRGFALLAAVLLLALPAGAGAKEDLNIKVQSGEQVPVDRFPAKGDTALVWTPSEFGLRATNRRLARRLADHGLEVWLADLHSTYFVPTGRSSIEAFKPKDIADLVDDALAKGKRHVILVSASRGAEPALKAARAWQLRHPGGGGLKGLILFSPSLYTGRPKLGEDARYLPITRATNLPVYVIQPEHSTMYLRIPHLIAALGEGGSDAFFQPVLGVKDGYYARPTDQLNAVDHKAKAALPGLLKHAVALLEKMPTPKRAAALPAEDKPARFADASMGLKPFAGNPAPPPLQLVDMAGETERLTDYRGKVLVVSFWATWCPPCVRELPSMNRLKQSLKGAPFEILGVNAGDSKAKIAAFLQEHKLHFKVLQDPDKSAFADWKVYVVPSNFVIDAQGRIRYGSVGAVDWQDPEVEKDIRGLVAEAKR